MSRSQEEVWCHILVLFLWEFIAVSNTRVYAQGRFCLQRAFCIRAFPLNLSALRYGYSTIDFLKSLAESKQSERKRKAKGSPGCVAWPSSPFFQQLFSVLLFYLLFLFLVPSYAHTGVVPAAPRVHPQVPTINLGLLWRRRSRRELQQPLSTVWYVLRLPVVI